MLSALVTGESLERLWRVLAAGASNLDSPTQSRDQLLPVGGGQGWEVLDVEEANLDLFRAAFSSKPQALATPSKEERGKRKKKGKGLGKKRNPCLWRYKDFCIHGECKYVKELRVPTCICHAGYNGERCHGLSLPVKNRLYTYVRSHNHPGCGGCGAVIHLSAGRHGASHVLVPQERRL